MKFQDASYIRCKKRLLGAGTGNNPNGKRTVGGEGVGAEGEKAAKRERCITRLNVLRGDVRA